MDERLKGVVLMGGIPDAEAIYRDGDDPGLGELRGALPGRSSRRSSRSTVVRPPAVTCRTPGPPPSSSPDTSGFSTRGRWTRSGAGRNRLEGGEVV